MENLFTIAKKIIALGTLLLLLSCDQDEMISPDLTSNADYSFAAKISSKKLLVFKGPQVALGDGKVRSWVSVDSDGKPNEIGLEFTAEAFNNLNGEANKAPSKSSEDITVPLQLKATQLTPFDHIGLNWNPNGHEPDGIFNVPHFDIHFYMISPAAQDAIPAYSSESDLQFNNYPPTGYTPADYFTPPFGGTAEAKMGKHWLPTALGAYLPFSKIMIYGSFDAKVVFVEPMITLEFLKSGENFSTAYSQPQYFEKAGNYPTKYNVYHDTSTGNTYVTLSDFVARTATPY